MFASMMNQPPKWSSMHNNHTKPVVNEESTRNILSPKQTLLKQENTDEHFSRHLENLNEKSVNNNEEDLEEEEVVDDEYEVNQTSGGLQNKENLKSKDLLMSHVDDDEDEPRYDEPKVFQVEDVDLPSLVTKPTSKPTSPLTNLVKKTDVFNFNKQIDNKQNFIAKVKITCSKVSETIPGGEMVNLTSTMPTPMHYFSRSSSMTSLNSFDIKSVHSSIASEYSQVTSQVTSPSTNFNLKTKPCYGEKDTSDYLDDLDLIMPESPSAQHESSFVMAQRMIHKQQQIIYRQQAAAAMDQQQVTNSQQSSKINMTSLTAIKQIKSDNAIVSYPLVDSTNSIKPWNSVKHHANNDLNAFMSRLNLKNSIEKPNESASSSSSTASESSDPLSFLNNDMNQIKLPTVAGKPVNLLNNVSNVHHTPPVKLNANPKTIVNPTCSKPTGNGANIFPPPMSVSYAFMKNTSQTACLPQPIISAPNHSNNLAPCPAFIMQKNLSSQFMPGLYQPKFLSSNQTYQPFNQMQFAQNQGFSKNTNNVSDKVAVQSNSSASSSCSSQNSILNPPESPTPDSEAPCVYAVETHRNLNRLNAAAAAQRNSEAERSCPLSPQDSVCSRMSDTSIPSLIRQDITRSGRLEQKTNDFKALFNKLNQNSSPMPCSASDADRTLQGDNELNSSSLFKPFNFMKSQNAVSGFAQQSVILNQFNSNVNTNNQCGYFDLDTTYSPKVFRNEGTNSRYSSASSLDKQEADESQELLNDFEQTKLRLKSQFTESVSRPQASASAQDDQDELLLENFIKEMLPPTAATSTAAAPNTCRMASSISSEAPFAQFKSNRIRSSGSSSSLNGLSSARKATLKPLTNKAAKPTTKVVEKVSTSKPIKPLAKPTVNKRLSDENPLTKQATKSSVISKVSKPNVSGPVVNMTKTAQLRASKQAASKLATSTKVETTNLNSTITSNPSTGPTSRAMPAKQKAALTNSIKKSRMKENLLKNMDSPNSVSHVLANPHLHHLNEANPRRKSFSFGCGSSSTNTNIGHNQQSVSTNRLNEQKLNAKVTTEAVNASTKTNNTSSKPKSGWK